MRDAERRLRALERSPAASLLAGYERLMAAASSGQLKESELQRLTDEQLWWLVANEPVTLPPAEQLEQRLREVATSGGQG